MNGDKHISFAFLSIKSVPDNSCSSISQSCYLITLFLEYEVEAIGTVFMCKI